MVLRLVDQGDLLDNQATISGTVRDNASPTTTIGSESDGTSAAGARWLIAEFDNFEFD